MPTRRSGDESRSLLMAAAARLFREHGYARTGTRDIAAAAGVSERLLYRHFGTKAELFQQVVAAPLVAFVTDFCVRWAERERFGRTLGDISTEFVEQLMQLFARNRQLLLDLAASLTVNADNAARTQFDGRLFEPLFDIVIAQSRVEAQRSGLEARDVPFDVRFVFALVLSISLFEDLLFVEGPPGRRKLVQEITRFVMRGASAPAKGPGAEM